jgi:7-alpha-hydroxysteroid dehydrogenase
MSDALALADKVAIVTGSGRGIGKKIALAYADSGCDVALYARTAEQVEETAREADGAHWRWLAISARSGASKNWFAPR